MKKKISLGERVKVPPFDENIVLLAQLPRSADPKRLENGNYEITLPEGMTRNFGDYGLNVVSARNEGKNLRYEIDATSIAGENLIDFVATINVVMGKEPTHGECVQGELIKREKSRLKQVLKQELEVLGLSRGSETFPKELTRF